MLTTNLDGIVAEEEVPVCPVCGFPIEIDHQFLIAQAEGLLFIVHYECGNIDFYNA